MHPLFKFAGRINMKRLEKWLRELAEKVSGESRLVPSGIIQMNSPMLHYLLKETDEPSNLLLAPAHSFMSDVN